MRALVVGCESEDRKKLNEVLGALGHDVTEADDGETALTIYEQAPFPLIVLDRTLRGMDGLELCQKLRTLPSGDEPFIIITHDLDRPKYVLEAMQAGANDYLGKPLEVTSLRVRLTIAERTVLERVKNRIAEDAVMVAADSLRALIEATPEAIIIHRNGRISYLNPAALAFFGYETPELLIGRSYLDLVNPSDRNEALDQVGTSLLSGKASRPRELRFVRRDNSLAVLEVVSVAIEQDKQQSVAAIARDIGERKQIESLLVRADRLASVGTLAAGIAHEINNPLSYVVANQQIIAETLKKLGDEMPDKRFQDLRELLGQAQEGAERVRVIVHELKSVSLPDNGAQGAVDIHRALENAVIMARNEIIHRARLAKDYQPVPLIQANEAKIAQVFLNLITNAAQAIPVGKAGNNLITIRTRTDSSDNAVVEITDSGAGISEEVIDRIFDPFYTTKPVGGGSGLGLSVCHGIITAIGGQINVSSQVGVGTTVRVCLKKAPNTAVPRVQPVTDPKENHNKHPRILIVDDEPSVARALRRALHEYEVTVCLNAREAIRQIEARPDFDLIFCDLMMPDVSGIELYQVVTHQVPGIEKRIVFLTGGAFTQKAKDFLDNLPNQWLEKPFDVGQIQTLVRQRLAA
jgi:two-component system, cell cycle sensor histidine kinase and response regulator CckA